jgi:hypothetical protein
MGWLSFEGLKLLEEVVNPPLGLLAEKVGSPERD